MVGRAQYPASALFTCTVTEGALCPAVVPAAPLAGCRPRPAENASPRDLPTAPPALLGTARVNAGCEGELAAALAPAWQEMVEMGLGEDEKKNGGWALSSNSFFRYPSRGASDRRLDHSKRRAPKCTHRFVSKLFTPNLSSG